MSLPTIGSAFWISQIGTSIEGKRLTGTIALRGGVSGVLPWGGAYQQRNDGVQTIVLDATDLV